MRQVKHVTNCRVCGSPLHKSIFDLGDLKINAFTEEPNTDVGSAPLNLMHCENCDLIQLSHTVREQELYENYWYLSRLNKKIVDNLKEIAERADNEVSAIADRPPSDGLRQGDIVLDIGANDGTLLSFYDSNVVTRVGCDPAKNIHSELEKHCEVMIGDFFNLANWQEKMGEQKAKVITSIAMFYDLDDPNQFCSDIKQVLDKDGVWIAQLMTAAPMINQNDIGNIIHEHIEYYSFKSLKFLFEKHGLELYNINKNDINGGSYQLFVRHQREGIDTMMFWELLGESHVKAFAENVANNKAQTMGFINYAVSQGKKIYILGASTKGNTIMQYYGLDSRTIAGAAEIHPDKIGKYLVGTSIPIVHEDEAKEKADYFLVFPFHFKQVFRDKIMFDWLQQDDKYLLFCTPEFEVVGI